MQQRQTTACVLLLHRPYLPHRAGRGCRRRLQRSCQADCKLKDKQRGQLKGVTGGTREWASIQKSLHLHDKWRRRFPDKVTMSWVRTGMTTSTRIDRVEISESTAAETTDIEYTTIGCAGVDHKMIKWTQEFSEPVPPSPVKRMLPAIALLGDFPKQAAAMVDAAWATVQPDTNLNELINSISDQIWTAYEAHHKEVKRTRFRLVKRLQETADKADALEMLRITGSGRRNCMEQLAEATEQAAAKVVATADLATADWGEKHTRINCFPRVQ